MFQAIGQFFRKAWKIIREELRWQNFKYTLQGAFVLMLLYWFIFTWNYPADTILLWIYGLLLGIVGVYIIRYLSARILRFVMESKEVQTEIANNPVLQEKGKKKK
jgi:amino acid transporter